MNPTHRTRALLVVAALVASLASTWSPAQAAARNAPPRASTALAAPATDPWLSVWPPSPSEGRGQHVLGSVTPHAGDGGPHEPLTLDIPDLPHGWQVIFEPRVVNDGEKADMTIRISDRAERTRHPLRVTATGASGAVIEATYNVTVRDNPWSCGPVWRNLANDGSFEAGSTSPWQRTPGVITDSPAQPASTGTHKAWFGRPGAGRVSSLSQTIWLSPTCQEYYVKLDLHVASAEPEGAPARDLLVVMANGTVLKTFSNADAAPGYSTHWLDLDAFADSEVRLTFRSTQDAARRTSFVVDEVFASGSF